MDFDGVEGGFFGKRIEVCISEPKGLPIANIFELQDEIIKGIDVRHITVPLIKKFPPMSRRVGVGGRIFRPCIYRFLLWRQMCFDNTGFYVTIFASQNVAKIGMATRIEVFRYTIPLPTLGIEGLEGPDSHG